jgi:hypothetical protein
MNEKLAVSNGRDWSLHRSAVDAELAQVLVSEADC